MKNAERRVDNPSVALGDSSHSTWEPWSAECRVKEGGNGEAKT